MATSPPSPFQAYAAAHAKSRPNILCIYAATRFRAEFESIVKSNPLKVIYPHNVYRDCKLFFEIANNEAKN